MTARTPIAAIVPQYLALDSNGPRIQDRCGTLVGSFVKETLMRFKVAIGLSVVVASIALMGTSRAGDPVDSGR